MFDVRTVRKQAKEDFEKLWIESVSMIPRNTKVELNGPGKGNAFRDMVEHCRQVLIRMGFIEMENKVVLPEEDVFKQYGPESPAILDRAFYLAKLPRPDIGLGDEKVQKIREIIGEFDVETLKGILRSYKKGEIEGDDFVEELVTQLGIQTEDATSIMDVFPEFKDLSPEPTNLTLRSHMTGTWYHTLAAVQDKMSFPIALFSVGPRFRNEQKEDKGHLRVHNSASMVVMDPNMSLEAGKGIVERFLKEMGFSDVTYEVKKGTSKYYAKGMEEEVFAKWHGEWLELGDIGMYSVISCANFDIRYPVFNAGFGIERLAMVQHNYADIRELVFPQFCDAEETDESIAASITYAEEPETGLGKAVAEGVVKQARACKDKASPCAVIAYEDSNVRVELVEEEEGKRLLGPAAFNEICVDTGSIKGTLEPTGTKTGITFMDAIAKRVGCMAEQGLGAKEDIDVRVKIVKSLPNVNLCIPPHISNYITQHQYQIDVYGPVFLHARITYL